MRIHHIGYLVKDIDKAKSEFEALGFSPEGDVTFDAYRGIDILFLRNADYRIELVSPKTENSVVSKTIKTLGNSPYHICYEVADIESAVASMRDQKYMPMGEAHMAPAIGNAQVVFMFNKNIGIVEFVERR